MNAESACIIIIHRYLLAFLLSMLVSSYDGCFLYFNFIFFILNVRTSLSETKLFCSFWMTSSSFIPRRIRVSQQEWFCWVFYFVINVSNQLFNLSENFSNNASSNLYWQSNCDIPVLCYSQSCVTPSPVLLAVLCYSRFFITPNSELLPVLYYFHSCVTPSSILLPILRYSQSCITSTPVLLPVMC